MELDALGISTQKKNQFINRGIQTVEDLVNYLPRRYKDFTRETGILSEDQVSCVVVKIDKVQSYNTKTPMTMAFCTEVKTGAKVNVQWFNQLWMPARLTALIGQYVYLAGKASYNETYKNYTISSPELFEPNIQKGKRMYPVYRKITGMSMDYLSDSIQTALSLPEATEETCPRDILSRYGQVSRKEALRRLHFPANAEDVRVGQERILFDDLLFFAISTCWAERNSSRGSSFNIRTLRSYNTIRNNLPYELTDDQKKAIESMVEHARDGRRINALVQGDVGCGKSIIAFCLMAIMADSGYQSVLMAPTQVLARQHYEDLQKLMEPLGYKVGFLGGSKMKKAEKTKLLAAIKSGEINMVVGTHAVIGKTVEYNRLALTITDEEHRFGVQQRNALVEKAQEGVHAVTMSATPIPRSLAQVIYGDSVQLHTIEALPSGRKQVATGIAHGRKKIYRFIVREAIKGHQAYVVCPMIDRNDDMEGVKSVEEVSAEFRQGLAYENLPALNDPKSNVDYQALIGDKRICIETLTGKDDKKRTEDVISRFKKGEVDVLISTTVIEVGVNVPTATLMVITNAERFGLASLHQLRGRVGRSSLQSYCVLESNTQTEDGAARLKAMCEISNGFKIAEADLKLRGAGDFLGTQQSGDNKYMALMLAYPEKYREVQEIAKELLDRGEDCCPLVEVALARATESL